MSAPQFSPEQDRQLGSRALHDAELIHDGARFKNGVLRITGVQYGQLCNEYSNSLDHLPITELDGQPDSLITQDDLLAFARESEGKWYRTLPTHTWHALVTRPLNEDEEAIRASLHLKTVDLNPDDRWGKEYALSGRSLLTALNSPSLGNVRGINLKSIAFLHAFAEQGLWHLQEETATT